MKELKTVLHIDSNSPDRLTLSLNNLSNMLAAVPDAAIDATLLFNGPSVKLLDRKTLTDSDRKRISELSEKGIRFKVCNNSLVNTGISKDELPESCEVVPAGIVELVRLQNEKGCAYIKP